MFSYGDSSPNVTPTYTEFTRNTPKKLYWEIRVSFTQVGFWIVYARTIMRVMTWAYYSTVRVPYFRHASHKSWIPCFERNFNGGTKQSFSSTVAESLSTFELRHCIKSHGSLAFLLFYRQNMAPPIQNDMATPLDVHDSPLMRVSVLECCLKLIQKKFKQKISIRGGVKCF